MIVKTHLSEIDWVREFTGRSTDWCCNFLEEEISTLIDRHISYVPYYRATEKKKRPKPLWLNKEAAIAIKNKEKKSYQRWRRNRQLFLYMLLHHTK